MRPSERHPRGVMKSGKIVSDGECGGGMAACAIKAQFAVMDIIVAVGALIRSVGEYEFAMTVDAVECGMRTVEGETG